MVDWRALIIIGAGRSGTNVLRDCITAVPGWVTWPCDEINLIWRHGNIDQPNDVFGPDHARPEVRRFIRKAFDKMGQRENAAIVVEKTCANALRVPFVDAVLPEARYIHLVRDGRDVALSAAKRWTASIEPRYLLKKLRYAPLSDIPHYGKRFVRNRLQQRKSVDKRQTLWGPVLPDMEVWARDRPLIDICARQWTECVDAADAAFANLGDDRVYTLTYEALVDNPADMLANLCRWIDSDHPADAAIAAAAQITRPARDWRDTTDRLTSASHDIMSGTLARHGYETSA